MIDIREVRTGDRHYEWIERLMHDAFPPDERRDIDAQRHNVDSEPRFHCCVAEDSGRPVGLFTYWDFGRFCYCEHFATDPELRNQGYGCRVLRAVMERMARPLVLEVEMPADDLSRRRIGFYGRHGLRLWDAVGYVQPPYRTGGNELPMMLMATEGLDPERDAAEVTRTLHRYVYGVER